jgi:hypothetical protein
MTIAEAASVVITAIIIGSAIDSAGRAIAGAIRERWPRGG